MLNNHISDITLPRYGEIGKGNMENINLTTTVRLNQQKKQNITPETLDPITLNPETATFDDIAIHAKTEQYLADNTIRKRIRYLKYMETHEYPLDLRKPTEKEFIRHIRYRLYYEKPPATVDALRHEKLAFNTLRRAYGLPEIKLKLPKKQQNKNMILPNPETVRKFWHHKYSKDRKTRRLWQYLFRMTYLIGMRTPSEIHNLRTSDIILNKDNAIITITESKNHNRKRTLVLNKDIATDPRQKTLLNWITVWRPRIANENTDALFTKINGQEYSVRHLGKDMGIQGRKVWEHYHPYISRHWSCTARLIEQKEKHDHWNTLAVKERHGHDKIKNTERYIKYARQYHQIYPGDWIQQVLKAPYLVRGKPAENQQTNKSPSLRVEPLPLERMGEARPTLTNRRKNNQEIPFVSICWFNNTSKHLSFSFFLFSQQTTLGVAA